MMNKKGWKMLKQICRSWTVVDAIWHIWPSDQSSSTISTAQSRAHQGAFLLVAWCWAAHSSHSSWLSGLDKATDTAITATTAPASGSSFTPGAKWDYRNGQLRPWGFVIWAKVRRILYHLNICSACPLAKAFADLWHAVPFHLPCPPHSHRACASVRRASAMSFNISECFPKWELSQFHIF